MTLRRRGGLGECDARTQGALVAGGYGRNRGRRSAPPRTSRRHKASFRFELSGLVGLGLLGLGLGLAARARAARDPPSGASPRPQPCPPRGSAGASPRTRPAGAAPSTPGGAAAGPEAGLAGGAASGSTGAGGCAGGSSTIVSAPMPAASKSSWSTAAARASASLRAELVRALVGRGDGRLGGSPEAGDHRGDRARNEGDEAEFRDPSHFRHSLTTPRPPGNPFAAAILDELLAPPGAADSRAARPPRGH